MCSTCKLHCAIRMRPGANMPSSYLPHQEGNHSQMRITLQVPRRWGLYASFWARQGATRIEVLQG